MDIEAALNELFVIAKQIGSGEIPQYRNSEFFIVGAFDLVLIKIRNGDAFSLLENTCQRYHLAKTDPELLRGYLNLLSDLARVTNTTELPDGMLQIVKENPDHTSALGQWYRLAEAK